jgi:hypothetical protein
MSERDFSMRLFSRYEGTENDVTDLRVQVFEDEQWKDFDLNVRSAGFLVFVYAVFTCQHLYLRTNAAERGLQIDAAKGTIHIVTGQDWDLRTLRIAFEVKLRSGKAAQDDVDYIIGRMKQCPVSRNIRELEDEQTVVSFA